MNRRRVVITGMGTVTPIGNDFDATWEGLLAGRQGVAPITSFDTTGYRSNFAAEVKDFDPTTAMELKEARKADRYAQFAVVAAVEAMAQSGVEVADPLRAGVIIGSGIGGMHTFEEQHRRLLERGPTRVSPMFIPMMISDMASGLVSIRFGFKGPNYTTTSACASAGHAIGVSCEHIMTGRADVMITGGAEASVCPMALAGFNSMKALSSRNDDPATSSRPFDAGRDGFVLGEGGGVLVVEELEHAKARGAEIIAEIAGFGMTADAYHMTQPENEGSGMREAMRIAVNDAGVELESVGYINAHGTSTHFNDKIETKAVKDLFGDHARSLAVSSTKSMTGHLLGAAGGIESAFTAMALKEGVLPPTMNYTDPDPECDLYYCPNQAEERSVDVALSNSFGFGGHNVSLCLKAWR